MSNPSTATRDNDTVAAGVFTVILGLMFGGVGIVIAALAVGLERAWNGRRGAGGSGGVRGWAGRMVDRQRAWLAADRAYSQGYRKARLDWWRAGADPNKRPREKGRLGRWARRAWAAVALGTAAVVGVGGRFGRGLRDGGRAANQARREGRGFRAVAGARPDQPGTPDEGDAPTEPDEAAPPATATPTTDDTAETTVSTRTFTVEPPADVPPPDDPAPSLDTTPEPAPADQTTGAQPTNEQQQEEPVTQPPQATETNLDLTAADLSSIHGTLAEISDQTDQMHGLKAKLDAQIAQAAERVQSQGGTQATTVALDSAMAVSAQLGQHLGGFSASATEASDVTSAAEAGLAPARDAQDTLHAAGARGEFVSAGVE